MTTASGGSGEKADNEAGKSVAGGQEAPPIEQFPAYGGPPAPPAYGPPGYAPHPQHGGGHPPPYPPPQPPAYPPAYFPPPPGYPPPPEFGAPYPVGYGYPTAQQGTNPLAIISLVASVLWVCGIGSVAGIVCGAVAINQIRRTGQGGYGLAVAGIAIGAAALIVWIAAMAFSAVQH